MSDALIYRRSMARRRTKLSFGDAGGNLSAFYSHWQGRYLLPVV